MNKELLNPKKIAEYREVFFLFDKDGDGLITPSEIDQVFKSFGRHFSHTELQDLINETDSNSNGAIDFEEFLLMLTSQVSASDLDEELAHAFQMFDHDKNGVITISELRRVMTILGENLSDKELKEIIDLIDLDGDGEISFEGLKSIY